jgi:hypothetical protein
MTLAKMINNEPPKTILNMQELTIEEFFVVFPAIKHAPLAEFAGMKRVAFSGVKQGKSISPVELHALNTFIQDLAKELANTKIVHANIHSEGQRRSTKLNTFTP